MFTFDEARAHLLAGVARVGAERVALDAACARVLAEDVVAAVPLPRFDFSAMDGYAVAAGEAVGASLALEGEASAGDPPPPAAAVRRGAAWRVSTGAAIPPGCDAVVPHEEVERRGEAIVLRAAPREGQHIRRRGEDIAAGAVAVRGGARLRPAHLGLFAALDRREVVVATRPRVVVLTTGDELRAAGDAQRPGSIPDANGPMLAALVASCGGLAVARAALGDDLEATRRAIRAALDDADVVVTAGGVSGGERDFVRDALAAEGVTLDVVKVAMKPGKPLVLGKRGATRVLGLPGNPAAAFVTFATFGAPLVRALQGDERPLPLPLPARLTHDARCSPGRVELARATLGIDEGTGALSVTLLPNQSAGALTSLAWADALAVLSGSATSDVVAAGTIVSVLRVADV